MSRQKKNPPKPPPNVMPNANMFGVSRKHSVTVADVSLADEGTVSHNTWLRRLAGLMYITSPTPVSVPILLKDPQFAGKISFRSMTKWCFADKWVERRKEYFAQLEEGIKRKVQTAQLKSRFEQLQELDRLSNRMHNKLRKDEVEPGTYEGMVSGLVKVEAMREDLRTKISKEVVPENLLGMANQNLTPVVPILSEEEARVAALAIIKKRQEDAKRKQDNPATIDVDADDDNGETVD